MTYYGNYETKSKYIRVEMATEAISPQWIPFGFAPVKQPLEPTLALCPTASLKNDLLYLNETNTNVYYGFDFSKDDAKAYLAPIPANATTGSNTAFKLENIL